jgi:hypothetical protein
MLQGEGRATAAVKEFMLGEVLPSVTLIFQVFQVPYQQMFDFQ